MRKLILFSVLALVVAAPLAYAQGGPPETLQGGFNDIENILARITRWLFTIFMSLSFIFFLLAAYKYLTSGGGEKVGEAHKLLVYAMIAIAVALLSRGFEFVVRELVTGSPQSSQGSSSDIPKIGN